MSTSQLPQASSSVALGWTLLRIILGLTFALHGWQKFTEFTIAGTQSSFAQMGVPVAGIAAPFVATFAGDGGIELVLVLAAAAAFFTLAGPGPWSVDRAIAAKKIGYRVMV